MTVSFTEVLEKNIWTKFFLQFGPEALFQSWEWGEVQQKVGNEVKRFGMWHGQELISIFQIVNVRARRGSFLHIRHGPICKEYSTPVLQEITTFLSKYSKEQHVLFFRISPLIDQKSQFISSLGYRPAAIHAMDAELCWVLPLEKSEELLLQEMRKTTRYEIRKAEKMGVVVETYTKSDDLHYFIDLYQQTAQRQHFVPHIGIREEFEIFAKNKEAMLYVARYEQKVIAAAIILFVGNQAIYHHGASLAGAPPGSYLIQWNAIAEAKRRGLNQYNFWGIADETNPAHPWRGITLFKKGFGGQEKKYLHAQDYAVSPLYIIPKSIETLRRIRKGY